MKRKDVLVFDVVVAHDQLFGIGKSGMLPWSIPEDMQNFRKITLDHKIRSGSAVIMGTTTAISLPGRKPLKDRTNIVLSRRTPPGEKDGFLYFGSFVDALVHCKKKDLHPYVIGGEMVYNYALEHHRHVRHLYVTKVSGSYNCDRRIPDYTEKFQMMSSSEWMTSLRGPMFRFEQWLPR